MSDHRPNFFIIGAPKCGTTSLAKWLSDHPQVYMSPVKEPHYFNRDHHYRNIPEEDAYVRLFDGVTDAHRAVGEASVFYLFSDVAVPEIEAAVSGARYIVMIRNPVEMAHSLHEQQLVAGNEHIEDFETAWEKSDRRLQRKDVTFWCREPKLLAYTEVCKLGKQIERLYETVPEERVHVIVFDDLEENASREYQKTLQFLNLDKYNRTDFSAHNTAKERTSQWLRRVVKGVNAVKQSLGLYRLGTGIMDQLDKLNTNYRSRPPLSPRVRQDVARYFEDDVRRLSGVLDRDLTHWVNTQGP